MIDSKRFPYFSFAALVLIACGNSKKASATQFSFISQGIALYKEKVELIQIYELDTKQLIWIT